MKANPVLARLYLKVFRRGVEGFSDDFLFSPRRI
jgi:hypothetical protein